MTLLTLAAGDDCQAKPHPASHIQLVIGVKVEIRDPLQLHAHAGPAQCSEAAIVEVVVADHVTGIQHRVVVELLDNLSVGALIDDPRSKETATGSRKADRQELAGFARPRPYGRGLRSTDSVNSGCTRDERASSGFGCGEASWLP